MKALAEEHGALDGPPYTGAPGKKRAGGKWWAHVACAEYVREPYFQHSQTKSGVYLGASPLLLPPPPNPSFGRWVALFFGEEEC